MRRRRTCASCDVGHVEMNVLVTASGSRTSAGCPARRWTAIRKRAVFTPCNMRQWGRNVGSNFARAVLTLSSAEKDSAHPSHDPTGAHNAIPDNAVGVLALLGLFDVRSLRQSGASSDRARLSYRPAQQQSLPPTLQRTADDAGTGPSAKGRGNRCAALAEMATSMRQPAFLRIVGSDPWSPAPESIHSIEGTSGSNDISVATVPATRPESTYKSGKVVQTTGATSLSYGTMSLVALPFPDLARCFTLEIRP